MDAQSAHIMPGGVNSSSYDGSGMGFDPAYSLGKAPLNPYPTLPEHMGHDTCNHARPDAAAVRPLSFDHPESHSLLQWIATTQTTGAKVLHSGASLGAPSISQPLPDVLSGADPGGEAEPSSRNHSVKRIEHYCVESHYRANINDKIRALEDLLPSPHRPDQPEAGGQHCPRDCGEGSASKRSKGEILSLAIDYIKYLKVKESWQEEKVRELQSRIWATRKALGLENDMEIDSFAT